MGGIEGGGPRVQRGGRVLHGVWIFRHVSHLKVCHVVAAGCVGAWERGRGSMAQLLGEGHMPTANV